jgi:hypothetical protein
MVKRFLKYAMMLMAVVSFATFSSCGDDDDEPESTDDLVGTWAYIDEMENDNYSTWECFQFKADGTGVDASWDPLKKKIVEVYVSFTWRKTSSGKLIIYDVKYDDLWTPNYYIEGKYLYMWDDDEPIGYEVLKKVQ